MAELCSELREKVLEKGPRGLSDQELATYLKALAARPYYPPNPDGSGRLEQEILEVAEERAAAILQGPGDLDDRLATAISQEITARIFDRLVREGTVRRDSGEAGTFAVGSAAPAGLDLAQVRGQEVAKRCLEVAAAGGHRVLLVGPTGSGKTQLAHRVLGLLPALTIEEQHEVEALYRAAGRSVVAHKRPFVEVTPTATTRELLGGGAQPRSGLVSLAHPGILLLDGLERFSCRFLERLREPVEQGAVTFHRPGGSWKFPARFVFVATMRSCRCGFRGHGERECRCTPRAIEKHWERVPTWLRESFDIVVEVYPVGEAELRSRPGERSAEYLDRVYRARRRQHARAGHAGSEGLNANVARDIGELQEELDAGGRRLLDEVRRWFPEGIPYLADARGEERVLRIARTVADLQGSERVSAPHLAEVIHYGDSQRLGFGPRDPAKNAGGAEGKR